MFVYAYCRLGLILTILFRHVLSIVWQSIGRLHLYVPALNGHDILPHKILK